MSASTPRAKSTMLVWARRCAGSIWSGNPSHIGELAGCPGWSAASPTRIEPGHLPTRTLVYRFREYDLHAYAVQFSHAWLGEHLDSNTVQKLATRAFQTVQQHAFGKRGRPRFRGKNRLHSVEGKSNASGILWRDNRVVWKGLELHPILDDDPVIQHGLAARVKYVRLVRREMAGRNRFYAQLICEGEPYRKPQTPHRRRRCGPGHRSEHDRCDRRRPSPPAAFL